MKPPPTDAVPPNATRRRLAPRWLSAPVLRGVLDAADRRFGLAMVASGMQQQRHEARLTREIAGGELQWPELLRAAAEASRRRDSLSGVLLQHGYRDVFVRRWIAGRLEDELRYHTVP